MTEGRISQLRQRMIEDMNFRHFATNTKKLTFGRPIQRQFIV